MGYGFSMVSRVEVTVRNLDQKARSFSATERFFYFNLYQLPRDIVVVHTDASVSFIRDF